MREVVIITYSMIPHAVAWGGCQRMYYLADTLLNWGYEVTVFSVANKVEQTFGNSIRFNAKALPIKNKFYKAFVDSKMQQKNKRTTIREKESIVGKTRAIIKKNKIVFNMLDSIDKFLFNEPSFLMGPITRNWCKTYVEDINQFISKREAEAVIISGPPFGMFSIAKGIKKKNKAIPIILDYRDPWNLWHKKSYYALNLEKRNFQYIDRVVFTNENLEKDMCKRFPILFGKTNIVMNGYSNEAWNKIKDKPMIRHDQLVITYTGSCDIVETSQYSFRDVTVLFEALDKAIKAGCKIKLIFVGAANPNTSYAEKQKKRFGEHLQIIGMVNNKEAIQWMLESDALLILHTTTDNSSKYLIGGKLYDYIRSRKYILSIGDLEGLNSKIVKKEGIGLCSENSIEGIYQALTEMYEKWKSGGLNVRNINVEKYSREYQNKHYVKIIENCKTQACKK